MNFGINISGIEGIERTLCSREWKEWRGEEKSKKFGASSIKILRMDNDSYFRENKRFEDCL